MRECLIGELLQLFEGLAHEFAAGGGALCLHMGEYGAHVLHLRLYARVFNHGDNVVEFGLFGQELLQNGETVVEFAGVASCLLKEFGLFFPRLLHLLDNGDFFGVIEVGFVEAFAGLELKELGVYHLEHIEAIGLTALHRSCDVLVDFVV